MRDPHKYRESAYRYLTRWQEVSRRMREHACEIFCSVSDQSKSQQSSKSGKYLGVLSKSRNQVKKHDRNWILGYAQKW